MKKLLCTFLLASTFLMSIFNYEGRIFASAHNCKLCWMYFYGESEEAYKEALRHVERYHNISSFSSENYIVKKEKFCKLCFINFTECSISDHIKNSHHVMELFVNDYIGNVWWSSCVEKENDMSTTLEGICKMLSKASKCTQYNKECFPQLKWDQLLLK
ncbi:MAG: hypothetical protein LBT82_02115 [Oscillospiraceae bacterium]|jgi:hypothetical protein|nr:hypothetical protein [Oscillospiraceae bacterium]